MSGPRAFGCFIAVVLGATCVAGATAGGQASTAGPGFKQVGKWGKIGTANGQFRNPFGLATDKAGNLYVADTDNNRIQVFSAKGAFLRKWGTTGSGNGQFLSAQDVAISPDGSVWAADYRGLRVQQFDSGGGFKQAIASSQPTGVGLDAEGNLYVAFGPVSPGKVARFDKASAYALAKDWGGLQYSGDVEVSPDGSVYAADNRGLRVVRYDLDGKQQGSIKGGVSAPIGIGVDLDCNFWMGNISQRRVEKHSPTGKLLTTLSTPDIVPEDIAVGPKGDLYVLGQSEVLRFAEDKAKPATASIPGKLTAAGGVVKIAYTLSGVACPAEVGASATLTGTGISGKAAGLKLKAGAKNTIVMKLSKAASGKATFKIVLKTNGRPTTETRSVTVSAK
ncbi:MAG: hypothetical protein HW413_1600 [Thermoleophilia bacterium]|nr:hypothetical protein [Thermoleophilia bacterium]